MNECTTTVSYIYGMYSTGLNDALELFGLEKTAVGLRELQAGSRRLNPTPVPSAGPSPFGFMPSDLHALVTAPTVQNRVDVAGPQTMPSETPAVRVMGERLSPQISKPNRAFFKKHEATQNAFGQAHAGKIFQPTGAADSATYMGQLSPTARRMGRASSRSRDYVNAMTDIHEGFERKVMHRPLIDGQLESPPSGTHFSNRVLLDENNMIKNLRGAGAERARKVFLEARSMPGIPGAPSDAAGMEHAIRSAYRAIYMH